MKSLSADIAKKQVNLSPPSLLALGFLSFIVIGTLLLMLPVSHHGDLAWMDAWFTAVSAVTITGLSTVVLNDTYTLFGQFVVLLLIQCGGLGFMTFAILAALSLSPTLRLRQQKMAQDSMGQTSLGSVHFVAQGVLFYTLFFELLGMIILTLAWLPEYGFSHALYYGLFYSISAFNNAGFSLFPDGLISYQTHYLICLTISLLYMIGGLGFIVLMDIKRQKRWRKLSVNSRLVLMTIAALNLFGFLMIWLLEAGNTATLANLSMSEQALSAWVQATVPRSSGFNTINTGEMTSASTLLTMVLMFIGGGSLSTAGGIKVGTFIVLVLSVIAFLRRQDEVRIMNYAISTENTLKALAVTVITILLIFMGLFCLLVLEPEQDFMNVLFEVVSAACTVGLSRGITSELSSGSLFILTLLMFTGRLGPLTLAYLIATPNKTRIKHPSTTIHVG